MRPVPGRIIISSCYFFPASITLATFAVLCLAHGLHDHILPHSGAALSDEKVLPGACNDPGTACISLDNDSMPLYMETYMETGNLLTRRKFNPEQDCHCSTQ